MNGRPAPGHGFWHPAWRSRPHGHRYVRVVRLLLVGLLTLLLPAVTAFFLSAAFGLLTDLSEATLDRGAAAAATGAWAVVMLLTFFAPLYGIVLVPLALALLWVALRLGYAGWGVAFAASLGVALLLAAMFGAAAGDGGAAALSAYMVPVVLIHALVLWSATRLLLPEALLPPQD